MTDTMIIDTTTPPTGAIEPGQRTLSIVECASEMAMQWLAEDLTDAGATFGTELRPGDKPRVIVADADLQTRILLTRYGLIATWHSHFPLT
jgi:hypothetical protein